MPLLSIDTRSNLLSIPFTEKCLDNSYSSGRPMYPKPIIEILIFLFEITGIDALSARKT